MTNVKEILARNLKKNRRKLGITQPELAEKAGMSTHYLGMIEIARNFPTADMIERLAAALGINPSELFSVSDYPEMAMEQLQKAILDILDKKLDNLDQTIEQALDKAIEKRSGDVHLLSDCPPEKTKSKRKKKGN
ncbi:MAG: helix-turn-helix domain-containing protein [Treponema sp.]|jgi:transcriptional regulator with XRE-family HTH domain|nr:helix-turn-helix domain-containing protein [Treponema sp.]